MTPPSSESDSEEDAFQPTQTSTSVNHDINKKWRQTLIKPGVRWSRLTKRGYYN